MLILVNDRFEKLYFNELDSFKMNQNMRVRLSVRRTKNIGKDLDHQQFNVERQGLKTTSPTDSVLFGDLI